MKRLITAILLLGLPLFGFSQNLVPNANFEEYYYCPDDTILDRTGSIEECAFHWTDPNNGSSDYFNACAEFFFGVPENGFGIGYQPARSGQAYAAFGAQNFTSLQPDYYREYIHNRLTDSLIADQCYYGELYVNLHNGSHYAMNVGLVFTDFEIDVGGLWAAKCFCEAIPHIEQHQSALLTDTVNWMRINGSFLAEGGEQYITIGNFDYNYEIDTVAVLPDAANGWAYYYVEDVMVKLIPENTGPAQAGPDHFILPGDTVQLGNNPLSDAVYRWYPAEGLNDTMLENPLAFPEVTTTYYCIKEACGWQSIDSVTVTVVPTGLYSPVLGSTVTLSPNPNNGEFTISSDQPLSEHLIMEIYDVSGQKVYIDQIPAKQEAWRVLDQGWSPGLYFLQLKTEVSELLYTTKMMVSR